MKRSSLLVTLAIAITVVICGVVGYTRFFVEKPLEQMGEKSFQSLSEADKQRLVDAVTSRLEDRGLMDKIVGFGWTKDGFEILFKDKSDPQIIAIVREVIEELPLDVIENATCEPIPPITITPSPTPTEEWTPYTPPTKLIPAYTLRITFPPEPFTVRRGEAVTLPVAIKSLVDEPIRIRLALVSTDSSAPLPGFITYEIEGYLTVNPHETVNTQMTIKVSEDALLGEYSCSLYGELLEKPPEGYSGMDYFFSLVVEPD